MKLRILLASLVLVLAGCASKPAYRAAENGGFGYQESKLSDTQYRVHFKAYGTDKIKAMDYVMLRASELTLESGYTWFKVTDRQTSIDKEDVDIQPSLGFSRRYTRVTECGAISCRTAVFPTNAFETGIFLGGSDRSEIESIISIQMGNGDQPTDADTFNASQVKSNLMPKAEAEAAEHQQ